MRVVGVEVLEVIVECGIALAFLEIVLGFSENSAQRHIRNIWLLPPINQDEWVNVLIPRTVRYPLWKRGQNEKRYLWVYGNSIVGMFWLHCCQR